MIPLHWASSDSDICRARSTRIDRLRIHEATFLNSTFPSVRAIRRHSATPSSQSAWNNQPLKLRNTIVVVSAIRLFPSTNGRFLIIDISKAAALSGIVRYRKTPPKVWAGCARAEASNPWPASPPKKRNFASGSDDSGTAPMLVRTLPDLRSRLRETSKLA